MSWKLVVIGGIVYFVVTMVLGMFVTGPVIHDGLLQDTYQAHQQFWRPELNQDPPDMAGLMPRWITSGLIIALLIAAIFGWMRSVLGGIDVKAGLKYGLFLTLMGAMFALSYSGVFALPAKVWLWWSVDALILNLIGGAAMGWVGQRVTA